MTAINENGQVYFTFEELDFEGALDIVLEEVKGLTTFTELMLPLQCPKTEKKINDLMKVCLYFERLKRGLNYLS